MAQNKRRKCVNSVNLKQSSAKLSWILTEMQNKQEDFVTIVCKNLEEYKVSGLLLAAVSPFMSTLLSTSISFEDCIILMPDVELDNIKRIFQRVYSLMNYKDDKLNQDYNSSFSFPTSVESDDSICWSQDPFNSLFSIKSETGGDNLNLKREPGAQPVKNEPLDTKFSIDLFNDKLNSLLDRSNLLPDIKLGQDDDISDNGSEGNDENDDPDYNGDNMEDFDEESNNGIQVDKEISDRLDDALLNFIDTASAPIKEEEMDEIHEEMDYEEKYSIPASKKPGRPKKLHATNNSKKSAKSSFSCTHCGAAFAHKEKLKEHQKGEGCSGEKPEEQEGEEGGKYFCDGCGASFARKGNLARHKNSSCTVFGQNEQERVCPMCGKHFSKNQKLFYHSHLAKHEAEKHNCNCDIQFKTPKHKIHHMQVTHLKELVGCDKCWYVCKTQDQLDVHVKKHKNYFCDACGKKCTSTSNLYFHKKFEHDMLLKNCPYCPKKLNELRLHKHIKRCHDSAGTCDICGLKVNNLQRHTNNIHTEDLRFKCEQCGKGFAERGRMNQHMMNVHLKLRPYKCRYGCELAYNDSSNRSAHERKKHGKLFTAVAKEDDNDLHKMVDSSCM